MSNKDINEYIDIIKFLLIIPDATIINPSSINNITGNFRNLITLLISIATKSVPPVLQPLIIAIPIAVPTNNPPITPATNRLSVM